jgi:hypothetical protein
MPTDYSAKSRRAIGGAVEAARRTCWDFTDPPRETTFRIGDTTPTTIGTVEVKHYLLNGDAR